MTTRTRIWGRVEELLWRRIAATRVEDEGSSLSAKRAKEIAKQADVIIAMVRMGTRRESGRTQRSMITSDMAQVATGELEGFVAPLSLDTVASQEDQEDTSSTQHRREILDALQYSCTLEVGRSVYLLYRAAQDGW